MLKRLKLLFLRDDIVDYALNMDKVYSLSTKKQRTQKELYINVKKTIEILEETPNNLNISKTFVNDRLADIGVKMILIGKNAG